jgi:3-oxoadipate enol-lactonase
VTPSSERAAAQSRWEEPGLFLVPSFDGSEIAVRTSGPGERFPVLLVNAVGATLAIWRQTLGSLQKERRWVAWDLRGLHDSPSPVTERTDPAVHAADAIAGLDHLGIEEFAMVSWSNGSRIALEIAAKSPDRVRALAIVNGGYGQSLATLARNLEPASAMPLLAGVAKHFPSVVGPLFRQLVARPELEGVIRQSGLAGTSSDPAVLIEMLRAMADCDPGRLLATYEGVAGSSARELLSSVRVSTLLITGGRDRISPRHITAEMRDLIPSTRTLLYEDASHYLPIEYPARLAADLSEFLSERDRQPR